MDLGLQSILEIICYIKSTKIKTIEITRYFHKPKCKMANRKNPDLVVSAFMVSSCRKNVVLLYLPQIYKIHFDICSVSTNTLKINFYAKKILKHLP